MGSVQRFFEHFIGLTLEPSRVETSSSRPSFALRLGTKAAPLKRPVFKMALFGAEVERAAC